MLSPDMMKDGDDESQELLDFELEPKILQYLNELQLYRNAPYRAEAIEAEQRADNLATARKAAEKAADTARREVVAATTAAHRATSHVTRLLEEVALHKTRADLAEREKKTLTEECTTLVTKLNASEREHDALRNKMAAHTMQQNAYKELKQRSEAVAERTEAAVRRLEADLRRLETAVNAGVELRERARLAAAEHVRDRAWLERDLSNMKEQHLNTLAELSKLRAELAESKFAGQDDDAAAERAQTMMQHWESKASELREELLAERETTAKLSAALAGASASVAKLSAALSSSYASNPEGITVAESTGITLQSCVPQAVTAVKAFLEE